MEPEIRKITVIVEEIFDDGHGKLAQPLRLAAAIAVVKNPYAGKHHADITSFGGDFSESLGTMLTDKAAEALGTQATVFGKAALVGEDGEVQHGSAIIHTKLFGDALRDATKGHAVVPAAEKRAGVGSSLDLSLRSAHDNGDLPGTDTTYLLSWEVRVSDAPHADEILVISALGDGPRPNSRSEAVA